MNTEIPRYILTFNKNKSDYKDAILFYKYFDFLFISNSNTSKI